MDHVRGLGRRVSVVATVLAALSSLAVPSLADPGQVRDARDRLDAVRQQASQAEDRLEQLSRDVELAVEAYNEARAEHGEVRQRSAEAVAALDDLQVRMEAGQANADAFARTLYRGGGGAYELEALLGAGSPTDVRIRAVYLRSAAEDKLDLVSQLGVDRESYLSQLADLRQLRVDLAAAEDRMDRRRTQVETMLVHQEEEVARLRGATARAEQDYTQAVHEERERIERERVERERAERERAEREQQARDAARQRAASQAATSSRGDGASPASVPDGDAPPPSDAAGVAVDAALSQVGKPYRWGAEGPDAYDCSGLTLWAWAKAGVSLPHSSRMQYRVTRRVAVDDVQPGDLLFFGSPIHHVAMYIGDGKVVEAPYSGARVRINARAIQRSDLVGVGRPG